MSRVSGAGTRLPVPARARVPLGNAGRTADGCQCRCKPLLGMGLGFNSIVAAVLGLLEWPDQGEGMWSQSVG